MYNSLIKGGAHFYKLEFKDRLKTWDHIVRVIFSNYETHFFYYVNRFEQRAQQLPFDLMVMLRKIINQGKYY